MPIAEFSGLTAYTGLVDARQNLVQVQGVNDNLPISPQGVYTYVLFDLPPKQSERLDKGMIACANYRVSVRGNSNVAVFIGLQQNDLLTIFKNEQGQIEHIYNHTQEIDGNYEYKLAVAALIFWTDAVSLTLAFLACLWLVSTFRMIGLITAFIVSAIFFFTAKAVKKRIPKFTAAETTQLNDFARQQITSNQPHPGPQYHVI